MTTSAVADACVDVVRGACLAGFDRRDRATKGAGVVGATGLVWPPGRSHSKRRLASRDAPTPRKIPPPINQFCQKSRSSILVTRMVARIGAALSQLTLLVPWPRRLAR